MKKYTFTRTIVRTELVDEFCSIEIPNDVDPEDYIWEHLDYAQVLYDEPMETISQETEDVFDVEENTDV